MLCLEKRLVRRTGLALGIVALTVALAYAHAATFVVGCNTCPAVGGTKFLGTASTRKAAEEIRNRHLKVYPGHHVQIE